jgi:XTP/dITP diphosphohydrolase
MTNCADRRARFTCCLCFVDEQGHESFFTGHLEGEIGVSARGTQGFGYDPLFFIADKNRSLAELSNAEKNALSHRFAAVDLFRQVLAR